MNRNLFVGLAPLLAVAAFAVMPVVAGAETQPHWYVKGKLIKEGERVPVMTWGTRTFTSKLGSTTCKTSGPGNIENPVGGGAGVSETVDLAGAYYECSAAACPATTVVTIAVSDPGSGPSGERPPDADDHQAGRLAGGGKKESPKLNIENAELTVECVRDTVTEEKDKEELLGSLLFTGALTPTVRKGKPLHIEFGVGSGELESHPPEPEEPEKVKVTGHSNVVGFESVEVMTV